MSVNKKNMKVVKKRNIIQHVATKEKIRIEIVREIYNAIEDDIFIRLALAKPDMPVQIRLFEGFTIEAVVQPEKQKKNNLNGESITVEETTKVKSKWTRSYQEKLNEYQKFSGKQSRGR